jgi:hypothetical protein
VKRFAIVPLLLCAAFCQTPQPGSSRTAAIPGHGAISIQIVPNPIIARPAGGNLYDFPLDVVVHETGGRGVTVSRVTATVYGPAGIRLGDQSWDATQIAAAGYSTNVSGNGELRYHFVPRKSVPDDRLFGSVRADVRVDAYDETATPTSATTTVTITR